MWQIEQSDSLKNNLLVYVYTYIKKQTISCSPREVKTLEIRFIGRRSSFLKLLLELSKSTFLWDLTRDLVDNLNVLDVYWQGYSGKM